MTCRSAVDCSTTELTARILSYLSPIHIKRVTIWFLSAFRLDLTGVSCPIQICTAAYVKTPTVIDKTNKSIITKSLSAPLIHPQSRTITPRCARSYMPQQTRRRLTGAFAG